MSDIGCGDNSCVFRVLRSGGMGTNGGCRCFENLVAWLPEENRWNRDEVRKVEQDTQRLRGELRRVSALLLAARRFIESDTCRHHEEKAEFLAALDKTAL